MAQQPQTPEVKLTISPDDRWEAGLDHDPRSEALYRFLADYDLEFGDDSMGFKAGGDGDNGEALMYLLDEYYAALDSENPADESTTSDQPTH